MKKYFETFLGYSFMTLSFVLAIAIRAIIAALPIALVAYIVFRLI